MRKVASRWGPPGGSIWVDGGGSISPRSLFLGFEENTFEALDQTHQRDAGAGVPPLDGGDTAGSPVTGKGWRWPSFPLGSGQLGGPGSRIAGCPGGEPRMGTGPSGARGWCHRRPLWVKATRKTYAGHIELRLR